MRRSLPLTDEQARARIAAYRGALGTSRAVIGFTAQAVLDALPLATNPVTRTWISYSTTTLGRLAKDCEAQGLPLDRSVVLDRARIDRFLSHTCSHLASGTKASYRSRLDILARALLDGQNDGPWPRAILSGGDPLAPWDDEQAARIALWSTGVRPDRRRHRLRTALSLSLGAGLRRRDLVLVTGEHVVQDRHGVHVAVPAGDAVRARAVTVTAAWEAEVMLAADRAGDRLLVAPDRPSLTEHPLSVMLERVNRTAPAGDEFSLRRARNTWLVRHMAAGTPVPLLMEQAGLGTMDVLQNLLPFVPQADPAAAASFMRGARA